MFFRSIAARGHALKLPTLVSVARCDGDKPSEEEGADFDGGDGGFGGLDDEEKTQGPRFRPPMAFENLMGTLRQGSVNNYDGFRVIVQKQVNMNTVASHFYWIGSQSAPPIYQYRLILPFDDKVVNVATDMDFNVEGEVRCPLLPNVGAKVSFSVHEQQGNNLTFDIDMADESSATQLQYTSGNTLSLSFMQSMSKSIILGGLAEYIGNKSLVNLSFGGVYDDGDNVFAAQWDKNVSPVSFYNPPPPPPIRLPSSQSRICISEMPTNGT